MQSDNNNKLVGPVTITYIKLQKLKTLKKLLNMT